MEVTYFQKNLLGKEEASFQNYIQEKTPAIKSLLTKFASDSKILKASIEKFEKHDAYEVELSLSLPTTTINAKEASHSLTKAVDLSKDRLIVQLKKHMALLRKDRQHQSIREGERVEKTESVYLQS